MKTKSLDKNKNFECRGMGTKKYHKPLESSQNAKEGHQDSSLNQHFNKLTPAEQERLVILAEECAEVGQAIGKILRHGYENKYKDGTINRQQLEIEIGDVWQAFRLLIKNDDINWLNVLDNAELKHEKQKQYLHHQG